MMKTIQITIDENLLQEVDSAVQELGTNRSAFLRDALRRSLKRLEIASMESRHVAGYKQHPVQPGEFDIWYEEQIWEDVA